MELQKLFSVIWLSALSFLPAYCYLSVDENLYLKILYPQDISYVYAIRPARIGGLFEEYFDHIHLVPSIPADACQEIENVADVQNEIALVKRGHCSFLEKTINVARTGAMAIIIYDNDLGNDWHFIDMIGDETNRETRLPAAFMLGRDGQRIMESLVKNGEKSAVLTIPYNITGIPIGTINKPPWTLW